MDNKRDVSYTKWVDFYNSHFKNTLNKLITNIENEPNNIRILICKEVYECALQTLKIYLRNNGLFKETNCDVIKESFYIDFIENGEDWIEIFEYFENSDKLITDSDFINKCLEAFNILDKKFIGALEDDD